MNFFAVCGAEKLLTDACDLTIDTAPAFLIDAS
jgi:hypothetical protein